MAVAFRSVSTSHVTSATQTTTNKPSGVVDGDMLYAIVRIGNSQTVTAPTGWTLVDVSGSGTTFTWFYEKRASSEGANYTWSWTTAAMGRVTISAWTGVVASGSGYDVFASQFNTPASPNIGGPSVSPTINNGMLVMFVALNNGAATRAVTPDGSMTEVHDDNALFDTHIAYQQLSASGATGTRLATVTDGTNVLSYAFNLVLSPAPVTLTKTVTTSSVTLKTLTKTTATTAVIQTTLAKTVTSTAVVQKVLTKTVTVSAVAGSSETQTKTVTVTAVVQKVFAKTVTATAAVRKAITKSVTASTVVFGTVAMTVSVSAIATKPITKVKTILVYALLSGPAKQVTTTAVVKKLGFTKTLTASTTVSKRFTKTVSASAVSKRVNLKLVNCNTIVTKTSARAVTVNAALVVSTAGTITKHFTATAAVGAVDVSITGELTDPDISVTLTALFDN